MSDTLKFIENFKLLLIKPIQHSIDSITAIPGSIDVAFSGAITAALVKGQLITRQQRRIDNLNLGNTGLQPDTAHI